jgi:hypothetical protein
MKYNFITLGSLIPFFLDDYKMFGFIHMKINLIPDFHL